jgi:hypothetical protein
MSISHKFIYCRSIETNIQHRQTSTPCWLTPLCLVQPPHNAPASSRTAPPWRWSRTTLPRRYRCLRLSAQQKTHRCCRKSPCTRVPSSLYLSLSQPCLYLDSIMDAWQQLIWLVWILHIRKRFCTTTPHRKRFCMKMHVADKVLYYWCNYLGQGSLIETKGMAEDDCGERELACSASEISPSHARARQKMRLYTKMWIHDNTVNITNTTSHNS